MRKTCFLLALLAIIPLCLPAFAWEAEIDEDPMDDTRFAFISQLAEGSTIFNVLLLSFKCWENRPQDTLMIVGSSLAWDDSASYPWSVPLEIRIDKGETMKFSLNPTNVGGRFSAQTSMELSPDLAPLLAQLGAARKAIGVAFAGRGHRLSVHGSSKAVSKFVETCKLTLPLPLP
jgi:hypothetical protein